MLDVPNISEAPIKVLGPVILLVLLVEIAVFGSGFKSEMNFRYGNGQTVLDPAPPHLALDIPSIPN